MVFRMIVSEVLVDVQRRHRGGRYDQGLYQHECDESAHEDSLSERHEEMSGLPAQLAGSRRDNRQFIHAQAFKNPFGRARDPSDPPLSHDP
jgi:hypothetical protein